MADCRPCTAIWSRRAAFRVGATIEDINIRDLDNAIASTDNQDLKLVYGNLENASRNHMRAFVAQLGSLGEGYSAQYIPAATLAEILAGAPGNGGMCASGSRNGGNCAGRMGNGSCRRGTANCTGTCLNGSGAQGTGTMQGGGRRGIGGGNGTCPMGNTPATTPGTGSRRPW
jgi:Uncharacterized protein domain (DUF2202)